MSSIKSLTQGTAILALALSSAACASMPEASAPMGFGAQAAAPRGFVQFCERQPMDCGASPDEVRTMALASATASAQPVAAITYDWSQVFPRAQVAAAAPSSPIVKAASVTYDWSGAFAPKAGEQAFKPALHPIRYDAPVRTRGRARGTSLAMTGETWKLLTSTNDRINRSIVERTDEQTYGVSEYWTTPLEKGVAVGDCEDYALEKRRALLAAGVPSHALSLAVVTTQRGDTHAVLLVATDKGEYVLDNLSAWVLPWNKTSYQWRERQVAGSPSQWAMAATGAPGPQQPLAAPRILLASAR